MPRNRATTHTAQGIDGHSARQKAPDFTNFPQECACPAMPCRAIALQPTPRKGLTAIRRVKRHPISRTFPKPARARRCHAAQSRYNPHRARDLRPFGAPKGDRFHELSPSLRAPIVVAPRHRAKTRTAQGIGGHSAHQKGTDFTNFPQACARPAMSCRAIALQPTPRKGLAAIRRTKRGQISRMLIDTQNTVFYVERPASYFFDQ